MALYIFQHHLHRRKFGIIDFCELKSLAKKKADCFVQTFMTFCRQEPSHLSEWPPCAQLQKQFFTPNFFFIHSCQFYEVVAYHTTKAITYKPTTPHTITKYSIKQCHRHVSSMFNIVPKKKNKKKTGYIDGLVHLCDCQELL